MFKLHRTRIQNKKLTVYISVTSATLKQSQSHQTYNDNASPKQGYNQAKFERPWSHGVREKANIKLFFK